VKVAEKMEEYSRKRFAQSRKPLMGHDHALTSIEPRLLYNLPDAFPVELQYFTSRGSQLRQVFLISPGALNFLRSSWSVPESLNQSLVFGLDSTV
jgi:hypothetical protein